MSPELTVGANGDAVDWTFLPPLEYSSVGGTNVEDAVLSYLQLRGGKLLPPAATLSRRVRGLALYLGMIRQGRLEWVVSLALPS